MFVASILDSMQDWPIGASRRRLASGSKRPSSASPSADSFLHSFARPAWGRASPGGMVSLEPMAPRCVEPRETARPAGAVAVRVDCRPEEEQMRRALVLMLGLTLAAGLAVQSTSASSSRETSRENVLEFDVMAGVVEPFTGSAHPIRGVSGGGLPWEIDSAAGELRSHGRLEISVEGLVLARRAPVPANLQGTNPVPQFRASVSCLTPESPDPGVLLTSDPVPASADGDARIETELELPEPCIAPIVFVTSPAGAWFAATGR